MISEEAKDLLDAVKDFCEKEVKEQCKEADRTGDWPTEMYEKAIEMELHLLEIPEEFGGIGLSNIDAAGLYEEMAKADGGFATTLLCTNLGIKPVFIGGTKEQQKYVSEIVQNTGFAALALTEPIAGSDVGSTRSTAVYDEATDEYVLNGRKCFITNAEPAGVYLFFASTDKTLGARGLSCFIVERTRAGIEIGNHEDKMGIRTSNTADVLFEDVRIPAKNLVGKEGEGMKIAMKTLDHGRPFVGVLAVGTAQRALDESISYGKERATFGKPIIKNQGIQWMLADMDIKIETSRQMVAHTLRLIDQDMPHSRESAIAKCFASDISVEVALDAIQIHGGYGYSREYPVEKLLRDAKIYQLYEGTNQIQRMVIAGGLTR